MSINPDGRICLIYFYLLFPPMIFTQKKKKMLTSLCLARILNSVCIYWISCSHYKRIQIASNPFSYIAKPRMGFRVYIQFDNEQWKRNPPDQMLQHFHRTMYSSTIITLYNISMIFFLNYDLIKFYYIIIIV